jgi:hypothetical protein
MLWLAPNRERRFFAFALGLWVSLFSTLAVAVTPTPPWRPMPYSPVPTTMPRSEPPVPSVSNAPVPQNGTGCLAANIKDLYSPASSRPSAPPAPSLSSSEPPLESAGLATENPFVVKPDPGGAEPTFGRSRPRIPLPTEDLFGDDLSRLQFKNRGRSRNRQFSVLMDGLLRHPEGAKILDQIRVAQRGNKYYVRFPGQASSVRVSESEIADRDMRVNRPQYDGLQVMERAYVKLLGRSAGKAGNFIGDMQKIFGVNGKSLQVISMSRHSGSIQQIGREIFKYKDRTAAFRSYLKATQRERANPATVDVLMARRGAHSYPVRLYESTLDRIVLVDSGKSRRTREVPLDEFLQKYSVEGIRFPLRSKRKVTFQEDLPAKRATAARTESAAPPSTNFRLPPLYRALFGNDLKNVHFEQGGRADCFLLAAIKAMLDHPQGERILSKIAIERLPGRTERYSVQFPSQSQPVFVNRTELGHGVASDHLGVPLLEKAYEKMLEGMVERNEVNPLNGSQSLELLFGPATARQILASYGEANANVGRLLHTLFGETYRDEINALGARTLGRQRGQGLDGAIRFRDDVYGLILNNNRLNQVLTRAFREIPNPGHPADWFVSLPSGRELMVTHDELTLPANPTRPQLAEAVMKRSFEKLYAPLFEAGAPMTEFGGMKNELSKTPEGRAALAQIRTKKIRGRAAYEIRFPSGRSAVVPGATPNLDLAFKTIEREERLRREMNFHSPEYAAQRMFGTTAQDLPSPLNENQVRRYIRQASDTAARAPAQAAVLVAARGNHVYSIRIIPRDERHVMVLNPYHTREMTKRMVKQLVRDYEVGGVELPLDNATQTNGR